MSMNMLDLKQITVTGELAFRLGRNYSRLEDPMYRAPEIFHSDQQGWPGDWEGRTILALCLHEQISGRKAAFLDEIMEALGDQWNARGYLGLVYANGVINEQQLSGHNWLLRGLLELYLSRGEERYADRARTIVTNLYLPLRGRFAAYPFEPAARVLAGEAAGRIEGEVRNGWMLSTDIGCAFISLDALAQYDMIFGGEELHDLLLEMIEAFGRIDVCACSMQAHATLSALRGILRLCEAGEMDTLLPVAKRLFDTYVQQGMTANYANYNWFGRPYWTEPCAIVDSYMAALTLFRLTKHEQYAKLANRIYYNALLASQRPNGGFGCDQCSGTIDSGEWLNISESTYEAWWCCSMRGAEGLCQAAANCILTDGQDIWVTNYLSGNFLTNGLQITVRSKYPLSNQICLSVRGVSEKKTMHLYLPEGAENIQYAMNGQLFSVEETGFLTITIESDVTLLLSFRLLPHQEQAIGYATVKDAQVTMLGDQILGTCANDASIVLANRIYHTEQSKNSRIRILNLSAARR